jgi:hypothetical protein
MKNKIQEVLYRVFPGLETWLYLTIWFGISIVVIQKVTEQRPSLFEAIILFFITSIPLHLTKTASRIMENRPTLISPRLYFGLSRFMIFNIVLSIWFIKSFAFFERGNWETNFLGAVIHTAMAWNLSVSLLLSLCHWYFHVLPIIRWQDAELAKALRERAERTYTKTD